MYFGKYINIYVLAKKFLVKFTTFFEQRFGITRLFLIIMSSCGKCSDNKENRRL